MAKSKTLTYPYIQYLVKLSALCTFPYNSADTEHFTACRQRQNLYTHRLICLHRLLYQTSHSEGFVMGTRLFCCSDRKVSPPKLLLRCVKSDACRRQCRQRMMVSTHFYMLIINCLCCKSAECSEFVCAD